MGQKNFEGDKLPKALPKNIIFQNLGGQLPTPGTTFICP
jgi:hypothetical protein